jgi:hypothetical protein
MIVFEEKFRELIALLPPHTEGIKSFPIRYDWGTIDVLNKFLLLPENVSKYPLIWLITGKDTEDYISKTVSRKTRFVIATRSNDSEQFNQTQYQTDFKNILIPVYTNLVTLLERSGITSIQNQTIDKELVPNYSLKDNGKGLITIWNAIVVDAEIEINGRSCINKNIKF